jgi:predicted nucleic acid-binding protein
MINLLFFDSDCISAFLWVNEQNLLTLLYPGRVVIPKPAYDEISYPTTPHLKQRVDYLISNKLASLATIDVGSDVFALYHKLTTSPDKGHKIIGPGEAASIVLAKTYNGIVASNNLKDISSYIREYELKHITTGDILIEALEKGYITEVDGNTIWSSMLAKRRRLGAASFSEYIKFRDMSKNP